MAYVDVLFVRKLQLSGVKFCPTFLTDDADGVTPFYLQSIATCSIIPLFAV